jgi:hypothetical protein
MLKYLGGTTVCDVLFGLFMVSWFFTRHVLFMIAIVSTYVEIPRHIPFQWMPEVGSYMTTNIYHVFLGLLIVLQVSSRYLITPKKSLRFIVASNYLVYNGDQGRLPGCYW